MLWFVISPAGKSAIIPVIMTNRILTAKIAKAADVYAINTIGIPSLTLMETASSKVCGKITSDNPLIIAGVGNNGGDGACIAKILLKEGRRPTLFICGDLKKASWEFLRQFSEVKRLGGEVVFYEEETKLPGDREIIDAVFGIGLRREVGGIYKQLLCEASESNPQKVIAIDMPSGINTDTGEVMGTALKADITVTFGYIKAGLIKGRGPEFAGEIFVEDIGIPEEAYLAAEKEMGLS